MQLKLLPSILSTVLMMMMVLTTFIQSSESTRLTMLRRGRSVPVEFDVPLHLELQVVDDSVAGMFETGDISIPYILHFCQVLQAQVRPLK
jgi:hypothetical protein